MICPQIGSFGYTQSPMLKLFTFLNAGTVLFEEGDRVCFCYVILQGRVSFTQNNAQTKWTEELGTRVAGQWVS